MKILVLNRGSSSIKCSVYDLDTLPEEPQEPIWEDKIEWKNIYNQGSNQIEEAFRSLFKKMKIDCIGHRIVHGGKKYKQSVRIDPKVKAEIRNLSGLAPLHNAQDLEGIEILEKLFPGVPQVAVFDTSFHRTMPHAAKWYGGPYRWVEEGIERYGFHGISFQYCARQVPKILGKKIGRMVVCHLGSGASLCAIEHGKSVDTTMGFTPLEGLMMDTRSGSVDPGILLYLIKEKGKSAEELSEELYEKSGLLGFSGISSDMRDILKGADEGNQRAAATLEVYIHRLISAIGSMAAVLGGIDALIFTAGIGENASQIREKVCKRLSFLGISLSDSKNNTATSDSEISEPNSKVKVAVIQTQEAFEIARECWQVHRGKGL